MATHVAPTPAQVTRSRTAVLRWAWLTLAFFVIVVLEGAIVRATSSGAGCGQHWPLCNGEVLPHHPRLATIIEFTHRSLTGVSVFLFAILIAWTFRATPRRDPARRAALAAGLLLLSEAVLGALLVVHGWVENNTSAARVIMQSVHFTNTLLLLGATTLTATWLARSGSRTRSTGYLNRATWAALAATVLTGATGSLAALADTIFPSPDLRTALAADFAQHSPLLIRMRWMHPAAAAIATVAALVMAVQLRRSGRPRDALLLTVNIVGQVVIGIVDVLLLAPITLQVIHLLSADIFWITLVAIAASLFPIRMADHHIPVQV